MISTFLKFKEACTLYGYKVFDGTHADYNLNIVGWRRTPYMPDYFNDLISVYWQMDQTWHERNYPATTFPGKPWLLNPQSKDGTAILVPGQYRKVYELGSYKGKPALKQWNSMRVYRDSNRDSAFDMRPDTIKEGNFGIHIHQAGLWSKVVGLNSAGCQVFQKAKDFTEFIKLCTLAKAKWGNEFSYTLLEY